MSKIQEAHRRIQDFYKQFGFTPTALSFPIVDYIELAGELFNHNLIRSGQLPKLDYLTIVASMTGKPVCIQAEYNGAILLTQDKILQLYAILKGFTGLYELVIGPYKYPVAAPTTTVNTTQNWTVPGGVVTSITLPQGYQASYEPSGVAIQNGIGLCSCDMVTLMNYGCKCGGK